LSITANVHGFMLTDRISRPWCTWTGFILLTQD